MTAQYTVVQYVPNPVAGERLNIGIITWDNQHVYSEFISDWTRARSFGGKDIGFLKEFAANLSELTGVERNSYEEFSPDRIENVINNWKDSIQFTEPRGSIKTAPQLVSELPTVFLYAQPLASETILKQESPTRSVAIRTAYKCVVDTVKARTAPKAARGLVRKNQIVTGKYNRHSLDIALVNGSAFAAVNAVSLGVVNRDRLQKDIDQTAWIFDDLRMRAPKLPLAFFVVRAKGDEDLYSATIRTFRGLKSAVISSDTALSHWTDAQIRQKLEAR